MSYTEGSTAQPLYVKENFVNASEGYSFGSTDPYEAWTGDRGRLYRSLVREYGRCTGKMYIDTDFGSQAVGWVFVKRMKYDDCAETYLRETWVSVHTAQPTTTVEYHYADLECAA